MPIGTRKNAYNNHKADHTNLVSAHTMSWDHRSERNVQRLPADGSKPLRQRMTHCSYSDAQNTYQ